MRNVVLGAFASLLLTACGGGGGGGDFTYINGRVMLGPVDSATVVARRVLDTGALGPTIGDPVTTDSNGRYRFLVESGFSGLAGVVATEGTYVDEATGDSITDPELELIGFATVVENQVVTAQVNALTTLAAHCAVELVRDAGTTAADAVANAAMMVEEYFGITGLLTTEPAELTAGPVPAGNAAEYGAANAGLSQLAMELDTPLMDLIDAIGRDGADCVLAGDFYGAGVQMWTNSGFDDAPRDAGGRMLVDAIGVFLAGTRNQSGLGDADVAVDDTIEDHIFTDGDDEFSYILLPPRVDAFLPPVGDLAGGTTVSFHGGHLQSLAGTMRVTFGGVAATVVAEDEEDLEVTVPPRAAPGKVDIRITDPDTGLYVVLHEAFEYYTPGLTPTITRVWPDLGPVTGGTLIDVTGANFDPTAMVRIGGQPAEVVAYLGRTALVVAAPANPTPGDYDVLLSQTNGSGAPSATLPDAFAYQTRDVDQGLDNGDVAGSWKLFALDYGTSGEDVFTGIVADATFDGAGTVTESGTAFVTSQAAPEGAFYPVPQEMVDYALFEDGRLWFDSSYGTVQARVTAEADVMTYGHIATPGTHTMGVGIRRGSGMSDASLAGTWHIAAFGHEFDSDGSGRFVYSSLGIAEFDGAGAGTTSLLSAEFEGDGEGEYDRTPDLAGFAYSVNADGTLTMTVPDPEGGATLVIDGIVAQRGDLAVGLGVRQGEGDTVLVMMTPRGRGLVPDCAHGTWTGATFDYDYEGSHWYATERLRIMTDAEGAALIDVEGRSSEEPGVYEDIFLDRLPVNPNGILGGGPAGVFGFMSPSRRFMVFLPTDFEAGPDANWIEFLGEGLLLRQPSFYSKHSIAGRHPMVGMSKEFFSPDDPPPYSEEVSQFLTVVSFLPDQGLVVEEDSHEGIGVARQVSERMEKYVTRFADGSLQVFVPEDQDPWRQGGYAVMGDGRMYLFLYEDQQLSASASQLLDMLVGDLTPDGDVAVLCLPKGVPARAMAVLVPESETDVPVDGLYNFGQFDLGYVGDDPARGIARAGRGVLDFDAGEGTYAGSIDAFTSYEYGGTDSDYSEFSGGFEVAGSFFGSGDIVGIMTPDGSAMFNLNFDPEIAEINLSIALRAPTGPVASVGRYRQTEMYHRYEVVIEPPAAGPAMFEAGSGNFSVRQTFDASFQVVQNFNTAPFEDFTEIEQELYADASLAVNADGSITWPLFSGLALRGSFDATARYLFLVPTDEGSELTNDTDLVFIYRR